MKYSLAIFLFVIMVSTQTPLGQLLKLPILIEHYLQHERRKEISVIAFLVEHYITEQNDGDFPEDQQLPFKQNTIFNICYAHSHFFYPLQTAPALIKEKQFVFSDTNSKQQHLSGIFHPPRISFTINSSQNLD
ncbi:MAG: hypothetical protein JST81_15595 [Bacteroidetes bacterium]|nr:hypothetical protein [Bacteroidota bacterium]